jgi:signal transduction histidine kinase
MSLSPVITPTQNSSNEKNFVSREFRNQLAIMLVTVALLALVGKFGYVSLEKKVRGALLKELNITLPHAVKMLKIWEQDKKQNVLALGKNPNISLQTSIIFEKLAQNNAVQLQELEEFKELRNQLAEACSINGYTGFRLWDKNGIEIKVFDKNHTTRGKENRTKEEQVLFEKILKGNTSTTLPYLTNINLPDGEGNYNSNQPTMLVGTPVYKNKKIIGALVFHLRPESGFANIFEIFWPGETGETYAFNDQGIMISRSRFEEQQKFKAITKGLSSILNIRLTDPNSIDSKGSFTLMAESALKGESGFNLDGYYNYQGDYVVSAWAWLSEFKYGIATEMHFDEAYKLLFDLKNWFYILFELLVVASLAAIYFQWHRSKTKLILEASQKAKLKAELSSQAKTDFVSKMSHELRTPLNAIIGFGQLLQIKSATWEAQQRNNINHILDAGNHLLELVNAILEVSDIESGKVTLNYCHVDANKTVSNLVKMMAPIAKEKNIDISEDFASNPTQMIYTDEMRFRQILLNLLSNSIKHNNINGKVSISIESINENYVRLVISDTGIGIAENKLDIIFEPFVELNPNYSMANKTSGLGLAISKQLIGAMGGRIEVESELGKGSHFYLTFPKKPFENTNKKISLN